MSAVADNAVDCALILGELDAQRPALEVEHLRDEELILVASPLSDLPDRIGGDVLVDLRFACSPADTSYRRRMIDRLLDGSGITRGEVSLTLEHPSAIKRCVRQNVGVAFLFRASVADDLDAGALREIEIEDLSMTAPLLLVTHTGKRYSAAQTNFMDYCRTYLTSEVASARREPVTA